MYQKDKEEELRLAIEKLARAEEKNSKHLEEIVEKLTHILGWIFILLITIVVSYIFL